MKRTKGTPKVKKGRVETKGPWLQKVVIIFVIEKTVPDGSGAGDYGEWWKRVPTVQTSVLVTTTTFPCWKTSTVARETGDKFEDSRQVVDTTRKSQAFCPDYESKNMEGVHW